MSAPSSASWQPPPRFDEYALVGPLGRGSAGQVFVAHDTLLDRHVAVKFIPARDAALLARFRVEARAAARIQHPNVASLYRVGQLDGHAYLVWELVRGKSLDQLPRPMPAAQVLPLAIDVARGLAAAHRRGVLHRDIKPGNIVVADSGEAKLVDFGLAAILDAPSASADAERDRTLVGTPYFMSPEAWRGDALDARSDLYALGLVLYELLAGEGPFRHIRVKELARAIQDEVPRPLVAAAPAVSEGLGRVVDRCLRRDPAERFASADELLSALDSVAPFRGNAAVPDGNPYRGLRAYDSEHRALFFGRTRALQLALERLRGESFLVVTGDSGVGKSSLCAAGVLPAVTDGALEDGRRWMVARTVPGRTPLRNVAGALGPLLGADAAELARTIEREPAALARVVRGALRPELGLLLYLDQMEELVTQPAAGEAALVAEALAGLGDRVPGVRVLATARSDFLSRLAGLPGLAERLPPAILLLGPMSPAAIREAIVGPARLKDTTFESDELIDALVASHGSLPLLQFTLAELWERRERATGVITAASLASVGGVAGALARHADGILVGLAAEDRVVARALLLRLVTVDDTRARRTGDELLAISPRAHVVLEALVRGRLLIASEGPDGTTYELAHEALVAGWRTLAHWLVEEAELRAVRHRLELAATEWHRLGRSRELLWSAMQLAELDPRALDGASPREVAFVEASRVARQRARWARRGFAAAVGLAIVGTWIGGELVDRRTIARQVAAEVAEAEVALAAGREALSARAQAREAAFSAWDQQAPDDADRAWAQSGEATGRARTALAEAAGHLERALLRDPDRADVRERYADLLLERVLLAESEREVITHTELLGRLSLYDTNGARLARLATPASVRFDVTPATARVVLTPLDGASPAIELAPRTSTRVPAGAWLATITAPGFTELRQSLHLERGEQEHHTLALARPEDVPEGFVWIPAGEGLFGSSDAEPVRAWFNAVPLHPVRTGAFLIARHETTFAEWIEFLEALPPAERELRRPRVAGTGFRGMLELRRDDVGRWEIAFQPTEHLMRARWGEPVRYASRDRRVEQDWRRMPVTGISFDDAVAYTRWLDRTGRVRTARVCTEHEWERAARATSDRNYPHGNQLAPDDANVDATYDKQAAAFGPDEVGAHPASDSPFGISDLSGNVWEWVASSVVRDQVVARGGSYYFSANTARVANRELPEASYRDLTVGLRVCATPAT